MATILKNPTSDTPIMDYDWIIFYDDGSRFTSKDGIIWDAPKMGAEIIVQRNVDTGYDFIHTYGDYFVYDRERGGWRMVELVGLVVYLQTVYRPCVLFGLNMSDARFKELKAQVEEEVGPKSGWLPREHRREDPE